MSSAGESEASVIGTVYWGGLLISIGFQFLCFVPAFIFQTEHFYDFMGAVNAIGLVAWAMWYNNRELDDPRKIAFTALYCLARLYLLSFLSWRAYSRGGDSRFEKIKKSFVRFLVTWQIQAFWVFGVSMPMLFINAHKTAVPLNALDYICLALFFVGLVTEIAADIQKARWVSAGRPGGFCTSGVWSYSRHPNYFGEILMWWCAWVVTINCWKDSGDSGLIVEGVLAICSPAITTFLLLFVSGLPLCEGKNLKRYLDKPGYAEYRSNTAILIPLIGYTYIPRIIKRTLLCEWAMYGPSSAEQSKLIVEQKTEV